MKIINGIKQVTGSAPSGAYTPPADWLDIETGIPDGAINLLVNDSTLRTYALKCTTRGKNLLTYNQATAEEGTDGFSAFSGTASQDLIEHWQGLASLKIITNNSGLGEGLIGVGLACSVEVNYVVSCYVKGSGTLNLEIADDDGVSVDTVPITLTNTWTRYEATISPTVGYLNVRVITDSQQEATIYIDGLQLELGTVATAFEAPTTPQYSVNWGDGTTTLYDSNTIAQHTYTLGAGEPCSRGYTTFKVEITAVEGDLLTFAVVQHDLTNQFFQCGILGVVFNSDTLTSLADAFHVGSSAASQLEFAKFTKGISILNTSNAFNGCRGLRFADTSALVNVENASYMFEGCIALQTIDITAMVSITNASYMFGDASGLLYVDVSHQILLEDVSNMFFYCVSLTSINISPLVNVTNAQEMLTSCISLTELISTNFAASSSSVNGLNMIFGCDQLLEAEMPNAKFSGLGAGSNSMPKLNILTFSPLSLFESESMDYPEFGLQGATLTGAQLDVIFTDLPTVTGSQVIDITGCTGANDCTPTIATLKGWTVTGYTGA